MAAWALRGHGDEPPPNQTVTLSTIEKVPVEVVAKGVKSEWLMVEVPSEAIPEPGVMTLLMVSSSVALLRRRREE